MNAILPGNLKEENKNKSHYNLEKTLCTMNLILDKAPYACCAFDQNLMVQYWSPKLQALTGIKAELAIGTAVEALLPVLANDINRLRECLQGKSSIIKNLIYHPTSSATQCNLELHYVPFATLENCPAQGLIHFQDVTAEYEIRNKLIESEERFKKMADAAPVLLWLTREDGYCTYVNQSWMDFTGKTLEEEIGFGWAEGIHPDDKEKCIQNIFKCIQNKKPFEIEKD